MYKQIIYVSLILLSSICFATESPVVEPPITCIPSKDECYVIDKELGNGAFGKVYAVHDSKGQRFALKHYTPNDFGGAFADALSDAKREFDIGQILNHPNIIKSVDLFSDNNDSFCLLLELVDGERVSATKRKTITGDDAIRLSRQLLDALQYSLEKEYLYLDLHANNVMISNNIEMKIVDVSSFFTFKEIKKLSEAKMLNQNDVFQKFIKRHKAQFETMKKRKDLSEDATIKYFLMWTFEDIVDMQQLILSKSSLDRETKIKLFADIKNVSWNYSEDFQEGINLPVSHYYDQLKAILEGF